MTTCFVTRNQGALDWAQGQGINAVPLAHLDPAAIRAGDIVIGTLPVHLAAEICAKGAHYRHLTMDIPANARGRELTADEMIRFDASLRPYQIKELRDDTT